MKCSSPSRQNDSHLSLWLRKTFVSKNITQNAKTNSENGRLLSQLDGDSLSSSPPLRITKQEVNGVTASSWPNANRLTFHINRAHPHTPAQKTPLKHVCTLNTTRHDRLWCTSARALNSLRINSHLPTFSVIKASLGHFYSASSAVMSKVIQALEASGWPRNNSKNPSSHLLGRVRIRWASNPENSVLAEISHWLTYGGLREKGCIFISLPGNNAVFTRLQWCCQILPGYLLILEIEFHAHFPLLRRPGDCQASHFSLIH